jgi:hypothetical protein
MRRICGEFGWYRVDWGTYGDHVIECLETQSCPKLKLEVSPNPIGTQRMTKYWTFVVWRMS